MKPLLILFLFISSVQTKSCHSEKVVPINANDMASVSDVVKLVGLQYKQALNDISNEGIKLKITEAAVTVKIASSTSGGVDLDVLIVKAGVKRKVTNSSSMTFDLKASKSDTATTPGKAANPLSSLIIKAAEEFNELADNSIEGLKKDNFELDLSFVVEKDANGKITIVPTTDNDINADFDKSVEHDIKLVFTIEDPKGSKP